MPTDSAPAHDSIHDEAADRPEAAQCPGLHAAMALIFFIASIVSVVFVLPR